MLINKSLKIQCVILAGGFGTRISCITDNKIPKCLIPINNIPFIDYQLSLLSSYGMTNIVLCIGYLGNMIKDYVKDGSKWNLNINYIEDGKILCGTGGALKKALDQNVLFNSFLITYGDSFLPINFKLIYNHFINQSLPALMTVYNNKNKLDNSNATFNDGLVFYDKLNNNNNFNYIDYGLSILKRDIVEEYIPENQKYDLATLFNKLSLESKLAGYKINERFYEIGSLSGIKDFTNYINSCKIKI